MLRSFNAPWQPMLIISCLDSGTQLYMCSYPIYRDHINVIFQCSIAHGTKFVEQTWRKKVAEIPIFATYVHTKQCYIVSNIKSPSDKCFNWSLDLINEDNLVHGSILSPNTHPHESASKTTNLGQNLRALVKAASLRFELSSSLVGI